MRPKTVTVFSNYLVLHQAPFCEAMARLLGDGFTFVATEPIEAERLAMGYEDLNAPYLLNAYESEEKRRKAESLALSSDVVITGSAPESFVRERIRKNLLTFRYAERFFKQGRWKILFPNYLLKRYRLDVRHRNRNLYMLCASAYTAEDCRFLGCYPKKTYRWGYFPPVRRSENPAALLDAKQPLSILWAGRMLGWKHPGDAVDVAKRLREDGFGFTLTLIGDGPLRGALERSIAQNGLSDCVRITGFLKPEQVRTQMERADVFLFTSDRNEGWGAVLNEAMNAGCAVAANRAIGSVPYLLRDGENGLIYDREKPDDLYRCVQRILDDPAKKRDLQRNAYRTVTELWNGDVAAERFLRLCECLTEGRPVEYTDGPCSPDF